MYYPEIVEATMNERMREAVNYERQRQARGPQGKSAAPRSDLSLGRVRQNPLMSLVARVFRTASA